MDSRTRKNREILSFFFSKAVLVEADLRKMEKWIKDREMDSDTKIFLKNLVVVMMICYYYWYCFLGWF